MRIPHASKASEDMNKQQPEQPIILLSYRYQQFNDSGICFFYAALYCFCTHIFKIFSLFGSNNILLSRICFEVPSLISHLVLTYL